MSTYTLEIPAPADWISENGRWLLRHHQVTRADAGR